MVSFLASCILQLSTYIWVTAFVFPPHSISMTFPFASTLLALWRKLRRYTFNYGHHLVYQTQWGQYSTSHHRNLSLRPHGLPSRWSDLSPLPPSFTSSVPQSHLSPVITHHCGTALAIIIGSSPPLSYQSQECVCFLESQAMMAP